jgi:Fanconi-associated nuclease 1
MVMTGHRFSISERLLRLNRSFQTVPSVLWDWKPQKIEVFNFKAERISAAAGKVMYKWKDGRVGAEEMALKYYEEQGWKGRHAENSTMQTIFGLLFWDIIFDDTVPGVFATPYQSQPLDMATPSFFLDRRKDIEKRLKEIKRGDYGILDKAEEGVRCTGVSWELFTKQDILEILQGLKGPSVEQICRMFAKSYRAYRGGAPDLILWNGTESKFVEVKSENDVLSDSQKAWMETLVGVGVNGSVFQII